LGLKLVKNSEKIMARNRFKFNLLPPKSKDIIAQEDKRSYTLLYSTSILFSIAVIWVLLSSMNAWVKSVQVKNWQNTDVKKDTEINSYNQYVYENYELYQKANILSTVVSKNSDPDLVFDLIDTRIKASAPNISIMKYGRTASGNYQITGKTNNVNDISKLLKDFKADESVNDVSLLSMQNVSGSYEFVLDLALKAS
jgi:hypothetical protein